MTTRARSVSALIFLLLLPACVGRQYVTLDGSVGPGSDGPPATDVDVDAGTGADLSPGTDTDMDLDPDLGSPAALDLGSPSPDAATVEPTTCHGLSRSPGDRCVTGCVAKTCAADGVWRCPEGTFDRGLCGWTSSCAGLDRPLMCRTYCAGEYNEGVPVEASCGEDGQWQCGEYLVERTSCEERCADRGPWESVCVSSCGEAMGCGESGWYCPAGTLALPTCGGP